MSDIATPDRETSALPPELHREAIQQIGGALSTWGLLLVRAANISTAPEVLEITRGARRAVIEAIEQAKILDAIEDGGA